MTADQPKTFEEYARDLELVRGVQPALAIEAAWEAGWNAAIEAAATLPETRIKTYGPQMHHYQRRAHADDAKDIRKLKTGIGQ